MEGISPAGDVWSLGMTLVEILTQQLPSPRGPRQELVLPETLPAGFLDIVHHCLQVDPRQRATLADIAARLRPTAPVAEEHGVARPHQASWIRRYAVPASASAGLALAAILVGSGVLHRPAPSTVAEQPTSPSEATRKPELAPPAEVRSGSAPTVQGTTTSGQVISQVLPNVPRQARNTIRGTVKISVRAGVDGSGNVVSARLDSPGPSRYFAALTLEAARRWEFRPPKLQGQDVPSEWLLRFELTRTATNVRPVQVSP